MATELTPNDSASNAPTVQTTTVNAKLTQAQQIAKLKEEMDDEEQTRTSMHATWRQIFTMPSCEGLQPSSSYDVQYRKRLNNNFDSRVHGAQNGQSSCPPGQWGNRKLHQ